MLDEPTMRRRVRGAEVGVRPDIEAVTHFPLRRGDHCRDRPELLVWFDKPVKLKAVESQSSIFIDLARNVTVRRLLDLLLEQRRERPDLL